MKNENKKRNLLLTLALISIVCVFLFASCVGKLGNISNDNYEDMSAPSESVAVIEINGTIQGSPEFMGGYDHEAIMNYVDELMSDDTNHAILLKVNSGGGTVYHSAELYAKLLEYKEITKRPIIAYFEQVAASGAYYISCAADYIYANENCWTGSIGVILSYTNVKGLYDKLGLEEIVIASGKNKAMGSSAGTLTDEQRDIYQSLVDESYETFVNVVSEGRKMDVETVKQIADGRIYTAKQALENGLIDGITRYEDAVEEIEDYFGVETYKKSLSKRMSLWDYITYSISSVMPKSDMEVINELASSELNGVPLYYYKK